MNDVVKYHNDMNKVNLASFSTKELDLFFSICFKLKEVGTDEVKISFSDIKTLIGEENNPKRVKFHIDNLNKKLAQLNYQFEVSPNIFERFVLFTNFTSNYNDNSLTIKVNSKFGYLLNNLIGNFTKFDLIEFVNLKSSYSKNMFKFLKQWESVKTKEFKIDEFRELLNIPKGFTMSKIDERILRPIMDELPQYFLNLRLEKIKTGKKITSLKFSWNKKFEKIENQKNDNIIDIIEISDNLNKIIEKVKKNRFITPLLTIDNIEILVEMFQEKDLIKGLLWAYKEVRQDISTLEYLIKTIRTGIEKKEKKIVVKPTEKIEDIVDIKNEYNEEYGAVRSLDFNNSEEVVVEKEKITKEEYEELYKKFLQEQNAEHNLLTRKGFDISNKNKYEIVEEKTSYTNTQETVVESHIIDITEPKKEEKNEKDDNDKNNSDYNNNSSNEEILENEFTNNNSEKEIEYPSFEECSPETQKRMLLLKKSEEAKKVFDKFMQNMYMFKREINLYITQNNLSIFEKHKYKKMFEKIEKYIAIMSKFIVNLDYSLDLATEIDEVKIVDIFNYVNDLLKEYDLENDIVKFEDIQKMINLKVAVEDSHKLTKSVKKNIDLLNFEDIPKDKLLSKKGTQLSGGALIAKLEKIARDEKIKIEYKGKIIVY